jgi:putative methyltransferase (TIGR04325 family)
MNIIIKNLLKTFLPQAVINKLKQIISPPQICYRGDFADWKEARQACGGYDTDNIIKKVHDAAIKVKNGEVAYERDSMTFDRLEHDEPLAEILLQAAEENNGVLKVLDFGGSLGSLYFQHRDLFTGLREVIWCVVEQDKFVKYGKADFEDEHLKFRYTTEAACEEFDFNVLLLGSVLPYIEKPYELITSLKQLPVDYMVITRTPVFIDDGGDRLTVQKVPEVIYDASYPAWFFPENKLMRAFEPEFNLMSELGSIRHDILLGNPDAIAIEKGYILRKDK